ncbi:hypothetical protein L2E82_49871 [Cichorium intybus]|uniref:Uncharacterized protein n=1 Tax=Cichorium intybus TaxID=13427 RepID=A0ACB8Z2Q8_CICIN|nr:hypothetical protein L2E82_49871 [Cichorium intybus]
MSTAKFHLQSTTAPPRQPRNHHNLITTCCRHHLSLSLRILNYTPTSSIGALQKPHIYQIIIPYIHPLSFSPKYIPDAPSICSPSSGSVLFNHWNLDFNKSRCIARQRKKFEKGHKYSYDWRTKKPTIFRATAQ